MAEQSRITQKVKMDRYWNIRCEHCGISDKALWTSECKWFDSHYNNGSDPPCSFDEYDKRQDQIESSQLYIIVGCIIVFVTLFIFIGLRFFVH